MAIHKEAPGVWVVHCDLCGERLELDTDPDDSFIEAAKDVREAGWKTRELKEPEQFYERRRLSAHRKQWINVCCDCQDEEKEKILKEAGLG